MAPGKCCQLADLATRQSDCFVPDAWDALDHISRRVVENAPGMGCVDEQGRCDNDSACNLMSPGSLAPPLAENHWSVIRRAGQHSSERKRRVMRSACLHVPIFKAPNPFAGQLIWPGAGFAGRLVGAVKVQHYFVARGCFEQGSI